MRKSSSQGSAVGERSLYTSRVVVCSCCVHLGIDCVHPLIARLWLGFGHGERRELRMVFMLMRPGLSSDDVVGDDLEFILSHMLGISGLHPNWLWRERARERYLMHCAWPSIMHSPLPSTAS